VLGSRFVFWFGSKLRLDVRIQPALSERSESKGHPDHRSKDEGLRNQAQGPGRSSVTIRTTFSSPAHAV
jgi:hypothetical protein